MLPFEVFSSQDGDVGPLSRTGSDVPTTGCPLLASSTVFICGRPVATRYHSQILHLDVSFEEVAELQTSFPFTASSLDQPTPWKQPIFEAEFARDAEKILKALGLPFNTTFAYMNEIASSFKCISCPTVELAKWVPWVNHQASHTSSKNKADFQFITSNT